MPEKPDPAASSVSTARVPSSTPPPDASAGATVVAMPATTGTGQGGLGGMGVGVAVGTGDKTRTVTARQAGSLIDLALDVAPKKVGVKAALQNMAKAINVAFQSNFGENQLESVYQAAIVRNGELRIVHKEYFGFGDNWFGQFGMFVRSLQLTMQGADPGSPEGQKRIRERGPESIRGLLNLIGRKMDIVAEYEDQVPAFVEQMLDRLEASGIIVGWSRDDWEISTTTVGLNIIMRTRTTSADNETGNDQTGSRPPGSE